MILHEWMILDCSKTPCKYHLDSEISHLMQYNISSTMFDVQAAIIRRKQIREQKYSSAIF